MADYDPEKLSGDFDKAHSDFAAVPLHPAVIAWAEGALAGLERLVAMGVLSPLANKLEDAGEAIAVGGAGVLASGAVASTGAAPLAPLAGGVAGEAVEVAINALRAAATARAKETLAQ